ncbi:ABC transporter permease [Streptococcus salivarius]|uniref:ABC transporter permease n=1 Tax=Streptococcus salivarius TaxID=1304 RepID=UPI0032196EDC
MKKIFSYIISVIALFPILLLISILLLVPIVFLISLVPNNYLPISPIWIIEGLIGILILGYGIRLSRLPINFKSKIVYWTLFTLLIIITGILFLFFKNLLIIFVFCQLFLPIIYILWFENKFEGVKKYIQKSRNAFCAFNLFDSFFIGLYFLLKFIVQTWGKNIESFLNKLNVHQDVIEPIVTVLLLLALFIFIPLLRACLAVKNYKKQNNISIPSENVFWNINIKAYIISLLSICQYTLTLFQDGKYPFITVLITFLIFMSFTVFFWAYIFEDIDRGGENKEVVKSNWLVFGLILIFLILLSLIESELIGILTWFLPILIPNIVGDINKYSNPKKEQTNKMKRHLYYLTLVSFNLLFIYNILSILSSKYKIKEILIYEFSKQFNIKLTIIGNLLTTLILLTISIIIALLTSKITIKYLKKYYLSPSNDYFK